MQLWVCKEKLGDAAAAQGFTDFWLGLGLACTKVCVGGNRCYADRGVGSGLIYEGLRQAQGTVVVQFKALDGRLSEYRERCLPGAFRKTRSDWTSQVFGRAMNNIAERLFTRSSS